MGKLTPRLKSKETAIIMWETQVGNFMTSKKVNIDFFLPEFSATKIVTCECNVDESTNSRYDMILGRDLITALGLDFKFSDNIIIVNEGPYEGYSTPLVDVSNHNFTSITDKSVKQEEYFIDLYFSERL